MSGIIIQGLEKKSHREWSWNRKILASFYRKGIAAPEDKSS